MDAGGHHFLVATDRLQNQVGGGEVFEQRFVIRILQQILVCSVWRLLSQILLNNGTRWHPRFLWHWFLTRGYSRKKNMLRIEQPAIHVAHYIADFPIRYFGSGK